MPSDYNNPLIAASELLLEINKAYTNPDSLKKLGGKGIPTVVAFGKIEGKGATNVIPEKVEIAGTFRTMNEDWREKVHAHLKELAKQVADTYKLSIEFRIEKGYPFLVNDEEFTKSCVLVAQNYLGKENVEELPLRMTAEDFAFISQKVPSCFFRLGTGNASKGITSGVHTSTFDIDERALEIGMGTMAALAMAELNA